MLKMLPKHEKMVSMLGPCPTQGEVDGSCSPSSHSEAEEDEDLGLARMKGPRSPQKIDHPSAENQGIRVAKGQRGSGHMQSRERPPHLTWSLLVNGHKLGFPSVSSPPSLPTPWEVGGETITLSL